MPCPPADNSAPPESPELAQLLFKLRELEIEREALSLTKDRELFPTDRDLKRSQLQALHLDNQIKHNELRFGDRRHWWSRTGTVVAWIAALLPLYYSACQLWNQQEQAQTDDRRARVQAAAQRFGGSYASGAFELALWPEGVPILVGGVLGVTETQDEAERTLAALEALESLDQQLTEDQQRHLERERDKGVDRLLTLVEPYESRQSTDADDIAFRRCFDINRRIRRLIGDGPRWTTNKTRILNVSRQLELTSQDLEANDLTGADQ